MTQRREPETSPVLDDEPLVDIDVGWPPSGARAIDLGAGERLGRYELIRPVARGGMASLWSARQLGNHGFEKIVALKTIRPDFADQALFREMFLSEARIASAIDHPNVARILDLGEQGDLLYLVMEWIDGHSLADLGRKVAPIRDEPTIGVLLRILSDVCAGLHAAHELCDRNGTPLFIVHRDVSPTNVLIDRHGVARLIDFGLAKPTSEARAGSHPDLLKGKVTYMAPEYVRDRRVDRRGDVWAIGVILYRFLSGRSPFHMESQMAVLRSLAAGTAPPPLPATVPACVARIVERALMPDPERRFASAAELQEAIEATLVDLRTPTTSQTVAAFVAAHLAQRVDATVSVFASGRVSTRTAASSAEPENESDSSLVRIPTGFRALRLRSVYVLMLVLLAFGAALAAAAVWSRRSTLPSEAASTELGRGASEPPSPSAAAPFDDAVSTGPLDSTRRPKRSPADSSAKGRPKLRVPPQPKQTDPADDFGI